LAALCSSESVVLDAVSQGDRDAEGAAQAAREVAEAGLAAGGEPVADGVGGVGSACRRLEEQEKELWQGQQLHCH
jgi:hypothetical protein